MKHNNVKLKVICFLLISVIPLSAGVSCRKKEQRPASPETKEEIPKELVSMYQKAEDIFTEVEKLQEELKKPEPPEQETGGEQKKSQGQQGEAEQQGQGEQAKQQSDTSAREEKIEKTIEKVTGMIKEMHSDWNSYETTAMDDNSRKEDISDFEDALDRLTVTAEGKNPVDVLTLTNQLTLHMADFFDLYKGNPDASIIRMKYNIRQIYLYGQQGEWDKAELQSLEIDPLFSRISAMAKPDRESKKLLEKLRLSLEDVKNVIGMKNVELINIKKEIALKNLDQIKEKAM